VISSEERALVQPVAERTAAVLERLGRERPRLLSCTPTSSSGTAASCDAPAGECRILDFDDLAR
jgi:hypothetical protein